MKSSVSLLGLTVGNYFNLCNWQQLPPSNNNSLPPPVKINAPQRPVSLSALTVEKFFSLCNWQLLPQLELVNDNNNDPISLPAQSKAPNPPTAIPCLTVMEFFSLCNWHSLPPEARKSQPLPLEHKLPSEPSPLTQQVQTFFQTIPWEGSPKIGGLPQVSAISEFIAPSQTEMSVNDLSKLF